MLVLAGTLSIESMTSASYLPDFTLFQIMQAGLSWLAPLVLALAFALSTVSAEDSVYTVGNSSSAAKRSGRLCKCTYLKILLDWI